MSETIVVEAVSSKFKNKYNSGSVLAGGKWMQVSSKLDLNLFQKDREITVVTKTNDKGYISITEVVEGDAPVEAPKTIKTAPKKAEKAEKASSYETDKNARIQVQGLIQASVQSPATINFGDDPKVVASKVLELTDLLIDGMNKRV